MKVAGFFCIFGFTSTRSLDLDHRHDNWVPNYQRHTKYEKPSWHKTVAAALQLKY